ncbi:uncharacterized protein PgNI_11790 [Pyricularia grisea]|uniref:Uncharacterized protein n=1 Tax=Pyricularia grisea TaxID=148305 RepID=A0A6P8ANL4_PYRGI|nr:uncharacterized protein PgNI_11790 [Pyricularia grisea]TLD03611.1 hypothetical protein PgNI_11790 [Pyricularia grisea]
MAESGDGQDESQPLSNGQYPPQPRVGPSEEEVKDRRKKLRRRTKTSSSKGKPTNRSAKSRESEKSTPSETPKPAAPAPAYETIEDVTPLPRCVYENTILEMLHLQRPETAWPRLKELSDMMVAERRDATPPQSTKWQLTVFWGRPVTLASKLVFRKLDPYLSSHAEYSGRWLGLKACILRRDDADAGASLPFSMSQLAYSQVEMDTTVELISKMEQEAKRTGDSRVYAAWRALFGIGDSIMDGDQQDRQMLYKVMGSQARTVKRLVAGHEACRRAFGDFEDATSITVEAQAAASQGVDYELNDSLVETSSSEWDCDKVFDALREASTRVMVERLKLTRSQVASLYQVADQQAQEGEKIIEIMKEAQAARDQNKINPKRLMAINVLWQSHLASMQGTRDLIKTATCTLELAEKAFERLPRDIEKWDKRRAEKLAANEEQLRELEGKMGKLQLVMDEHQAKDHAAEAVGKVVAIMEQYRRELGEIEKRQQLSQDPVYTVCKEALSAAQHRNNGSSSGDWPSDVAESEGGLRGAGWEDAPARRAPAATTLSSSVGTQEIEWDV